MTINNKTDNEIKRKLVNNLIHCNSINLKQKMYLNKKNLVIFLFKSPL